MEKQIVDFERKEFPIFEIASLKEPDQYGKTHTAFITKKIEVYALGY
ncbi:hypothetical protein [Cyclobacterium plantarum]